MTGRGLEAFCGADNVPFLNTEAMFILWKMCMLWNVHLSLCILYSKNPQNVYIHTTEYYSVLKRNSDTHCDTHRVTLLQHWPAWRTWHRVTLASRKGTLWFDTYWGAWRSQIQRQKPVWRAGDKRGGRELLLNGYAASVLQSEKVSEDWLHKSVNVLTTSELPI